MSNNEPRMSKSLSKRKFSIDNFVLKDIIGTGAFSKVHLAHLKGIPSKRKFAIKVLSKRVLLRHGKTSTVEAELKVLGAFRHRNIVRMLGCFEDEGHYYMALEHVPNGELFDMVHDCGKLSEEVARFYLAEVIHAIEFLHSKNIVHLDVKLENVLLTENYHTKLIDFGTCVHFNDEKPTVGSMGTPEYCCPELIRNTNVSHVTTSCDVWSIGVMLFKMLTTEYPFRGLTDYLTCKKILGREFKVPKYLSSEAKDLILNILVVDPKKRLTLEEIKKHKFFKGFDFDNVHEMKPPKFPPLQKKKNSPFTL